MKNHRLLLAATVTAFFLSFFCEKSLAQSGPNPETGTASPLQKGGKVQSIELPIANFTASPTTGCAPLMVVFTNQSQFATSYQWNFQGGTPANSTAPNPTVAYAAPGIYSVTLTAINSSGTDILVKAGFVTVLAAPTANFTSTANGLTVTFVNNTTNAASFAWNFGDGNTSTLQNPVHAYATDGTYTAVLTATNACGSTIFTKTITLVTPPTAAFSASPNAGCAPLTVVFTNNSSANSTAFLWNFPGGNPTTSTEQGPTVTYQNAGTFTATLTATNAAGSNSTSQTITVSPVAVASFTSSTTGLTTVFMNTSTNAAGAAYLWDFGDGQTSALENPTHVYGADGIYPVVLSVTTSCGTAVFSQNIALVTPPTANFSASPTTGCAPLTVVFTNNSSANSTAFLWDFPGGNPASSTAASPTVVYENAGVFTAALTATNATGSAVFTQNITVLAAPTANFTSDVNGLLVNFTNLSTAATGYFWEFGDGQNSTEQNPSHTYPNAGNFTAILTATGPCGVVNFTQTVTPTSGPTAILSATPNVGCGPLTVVFTNNSINATGVSWEFPGGNPASSTAQNLAVIYQNPGVFTATLTASNVSGSSTAVQEITVLGIPNANFTYQTTGLTTVFTNISTNPAGGVQFSWAFGDGTFSTEENPSHTYPADGSYIVSLTVTNSCGAFSFEQTVVIGTPPVAGFSAQPVAGCAPLTVDFKNLSSANATAFFWEFPGGTPATSTLENPVVVYQTAGIFDVKLTATNASGADFSVQNGLVVVNAVPTANFSTVILGGSVKFSGTASGTNTTISWNFGDGGQSTDPNPTHVYAQTGTYQVTMTASNECGSVSVVKPVEVIVVGVGDVFGDENWAVFPNPTGGNFTLKTGGLSQKMIEIRLTDLLGRALFFEKRPGAAGGQFDISLPQNLAAGNYFLEISMGDGQVFHEKLVLAR